LSQFDPNQHEHHEDGDFVGSVESGEPLPKLPGTVKAELIARLYRIGAKVLRSADRRDGWVDAYNAFAEAFTKHGKLTPRQYEDDIPNMVFNFALKYDWFPHLKYVGFTDPAIDEPKRLGGPHLWAKADGSGVENVSVRQSIEWFNERLRPALIERRANAFEEQVKYAAFREEVLELVGREASEESDVERKKALRKELLDDYKRRVPDPTKNTPYTDHALYNASQHSMHKPEFFKWRAGELADATPATQSFERFLKGSARPISRKDKRASRNPLEP